MEIYYFGISYIYIIKDKFQIDNYDNKLRKKLTRIKVKENKYDAILIGDSILKNVVKSLEEMQRYSIADLVIPGQSTVELSEKMDIKINAKITVIFIGINDIARLTNRDEYLNALKKIIDNLNVEKIYIFQLYNVSKLKRNNELIDNYNQSLRWLSTEKNLELIDIRFKSDITTQLKDGLHLNKFGDKKLESKILTILNKNFD